MTGNVLSPGTPEVVSHQRVGRNGALVMTDKGMRQRGLGVNGEQAACSSASEPQGTSGVAAPALLRGRALPGMTTRETARIRAEIAAAPARRAMWLADQRAADMRAIAEAEARWINLRSTAEQRRQPRDS